MSTGLYTPQQQTLWTYAHNGADGWYAWQKPPGASLITMVGFGGAGGGGGGNTGAAGTQRRGGGGGGSAAMSRLVIAAKDVPDILYIRPGAGGLGGAATVGGSVGTVTMIAMLPTTTAVPALLYLVANNGTGANPGASNGAGGAAGAASAGTECMLSGWGNFTSTAGQSGTSGGLDAAGNTLTYGSFGVPLSGGTGGGGASAANTDFAGGLIAAVGLVPQIPGGVAAAGPGNNGLSLGPPWQYTGGTGGGTAGASGVAGRGGDGAPGCGGGGGGGGVTGGRGGDGGMGMVWVIVSF